MRQHGPSRLMAMAGGALALIGGFMQPVVSVAGEKSVFDLFDRGVSAIVASDACGADDASAFARFTDDFGRVAKAVEGELQVMNPDRSADEIAIIVGFRVAILEVRTETEVTAKGCDAPEVVRLRTLFNMGERLAALPEGGAYLSH